MRFNAKVHSPMVRISNDNRRATRCRGSYGVCFSYRPVTPDERIYLRICDTSTTLCGALRLGLTFDDPARIAAEELVDYSDPQGCYPKRCFHSVPEIYVQRGNILF